MSKNEIIELYIELMPYIARDFVSKEDLRAVLSEDAYNKIEQALIMKQKIYTNHSKLDIGIDPEDIVRPIVEI